MTERLYYDDPYLVEFTARILRRLQVGSQPGVILDRTAFYPNAGGQLPDRGTLNGVPVLDVQEIEGDIVHILASPLEGDEAKGHVDHDVRFDHMQQHTGQHILSTAFLDLLGAETVSFHMGEEISTIDLNRPDLSPEEVRRVEEAANAVVFADRPVTARIMSMEEAMTLGLRKPPAVSGAVRVVEVEGTDRSACGGTHCRRSGEVGPIVIRKWERRGNESRVEFLCGWRALRDYQWKNATINALANAFSVADRELADAIARLSAEAKENRRAVEELRQRLLDYEAAEWLARAESAGNWRVVCAAFEDKSAEEVKHLALRLCQTPGLVALLATRGEKAQLVFARAEDVPLDVGALLRETCQRFGGRGGGRPHIAQGGGFPAERLEEALAFARKHLHSQ